ncbi:MAG TPA: hypothetical protein VEJ36_07190 [Nitrososphaerales archaeon]|nr:hypothetical protein [Nitrososphaerales archaeon]
MEGKLLSLFEFLALFISGERAPKPRRGYAHIVAILIVIIIILLVLILLGIL